MSILYHVVMGVFKTASSAHFRLVYRLALVTRQRRRCLSEAMLSEIAAICRAVLSDWGCELTEFVGGAEYVLLRFEANPSVAPARLVNRLKTATSRELRRRYRPALQEPSPEGVSPKLRRSGLWALSYAITSAEGAGETELWRYIENPTAKKAAVL